MTFQAGKRKIKTKTVHISQPVPITEDPLHESDKIEPGIVPFQGSDQEYEITDDVYRGGVTDIYKDRNQSANMSNSMVTNPMFRGQKGNVAPLKGSANPSAGSSQIDEFDEEDLGSSAQEQSR